MTFHPINIDEIDTAGGDCQRRKEPTVKRLLIACVLFTSACSGSKNPAAPSTPAPTPTPTTYTLSGTVTSTAGGPIAGATVRVADGPNAGRSATTASNGSYALAGLSVSGFSVSASATYFFAEGKSVTLTSNQTADFALAPTPLFTRSGSGNTVFDLPSTVSRLRIQGRWQQRDTSNFIVHLNGRSLVNEILRTSLTYDGIHVTTGGGVIEVVSSGAIDWTFTEVR